MAKDLQDKIDQESDMPDMCVSRDMLFITPEGGQQTLAMPWWLRREWLRIERDIYEQPTKVIKYINNSFPQLALHISKKDRNFVAYTPDKGFGERDAQLMTTLGKFLVRYYPNLPDEVVRDTVAAHMGELSDEFEIITGPAISEFYREMGDRGACMSYSDDKYADLDGKRPTDVYDMPNIGLAVLRNPDGSVKSRTMIYTPAENDKRYIRMYLDKSLETRLRRAGYVPSTWHGAEFKVIKLGETERETKLVIPYLDGENAGGSTNRSSVAYIDGKLISIGPELRNRLAKVSPKSVGCATNTQGYIWLTNYDTSSARGICPISGNTYNSLLDAMETLTVNGVEQKVLQASLLGPFYYEVMGDVIGTGIRKRWTSREQATFTLTSGAYTGERYIDDDATREALGVFVLHPAYYPGNTEKIALRSLAYTARQKYVTIGDYVALKADCVKAIKMDGKTPREIYVHNEELDTTWTKVHSLNTGIPFYAASDVPVRKTPSGRKVVLGVHNVVETITGDVEFTRNVKSHNYLGKHYYTLKASTEFTSEAVSKHEQGIFDRTVADILEWYCSGDIAKTLWNFAGNYISYSIVVDGTTVYAERYRTTFPPVQALLDCYAVRSSRYGKHMAYWYHMKLAEMQAVDYNLPALSLPEAALEPEPEVVSAELEVVGPASILTYPPPIWPAVMEAAMPGIAREWITAETYRAPGEYIASPREEDERPIAVAIDLLTN